MRWLSKAVLLLWAGSASAMEPPAEYLTDVPMAVIRKYPTEVHRHCRRHIEPGDAQILGCALIYGTRCIVILPFDEPEGGEIWRHEQAHCAGWRHG